MKVYIYKLMDEDKLYTDWNYIKNVVKNNPDFFSKKDIEKIEKRLLQVIREKKLKRVFNI